MSFIADYHRNRIASSRQNAAWVIVAMIVVTLCSCRSPYQAAMQSPACPCSASAAAIDQGAMPCPPMGPPGMEMGIPQPYTPTGTWRPPGIGGPWPADEYVRDGGVAGPTPEVQRDGQLAGLGMEDTVAQFNSVDGQAHVQPSNPVYMYAPRFSAVRQVVNVMANEQVNGSIGVHSPTKLALYDEKQHAGINTQDMQARRQVGTTIANQYAMKQGLDRFSTKLGPQAFQDQFQPYENLVAIRNGTILESEKAILARITAGAVVWKQDSAVQIILDKKCAEGAVSVQNAETVYTVTTPPGHPKLRVIKVASSQLLKPGEDVAFTIRFDNVGNQRIGQVAILDNLSTRLEYMPETAQSSLPAQFSTQPNEHGSAVLRWDITPALEPGKGGIIRFTCHVR